MADLQKAEQALASAPNRQELEHIISRQQKSYNQVLSEYAEQAVKVMHFEAKVDGHDILTIKGDKYKIEHLRWDSPQIKDISFSGKLPSKEVTVIPKDIKSRPMHLLICSSPLKKITTRPGYISMINPGALALFSLIYTTSPKNRKSWNWKFRGKNDGHSGS